MNQMYEQKYLKYKQKYLELKNNMHGGSCNSCGGMNGGGCNLCGSMKGGVILKTLNYKRTEVILPESFDIGNIVSFVGELSYKEKPVGRAIILYYISDVLAEVRSLTGGPLSEEEMVAPTPAPTSSNPTHTVKIDVTIILFDMTVYKFSNDNVPIRLIAAADRTLAPYNVNTTLILKRNTNAEKDLTMQYVIESGKGRFTIAP